MSGTRLTDDERADITRRYRRRQSIRAIAIATRRSRGAVRHAITVAGIMRRPKPRRPITRDDVAEWARRYRAGEPSTAIAVDAGRDPGTILHRLRGAGVQIRPAGQSKHHLTQS
jgi:hypothetical protein